MKIALPSRENRIDDHFGHCEFFTVYTINEETKEILDEQVVASPNGCGCKSNIATTLSDMGVTLMLAGNMGTGAVNKLSAAGIEVVRGCSGEIKENAVKYMNGELTDSLISCTTHDCHE
ncbi:MAG: NifB/NifX family molybdenum-iron cluster-binding protein [Clostridia bacterium]|nr:NifB/NifX family molybdenum-iron cluster-binding protein [Clostridia bacterium]